NRNWSPGLRRDSRLSGILHVLLHMAQHSGPLTSETLARTMDTNPVVVRRVMAGLRGRGRGRSDQGAGGGWSVCCDLEKVTLRDIYDALDSPEILAIGNRSEASECLVEQAVNAALGKAFDEAETLLITRFGEVVLANLLADVRSRSQRRRKGRDK